VRSPGFAAPLLLVLAACAHPPAKMSFAEAGLVEPIEPEQSAPPPVANPAPRSIAAEPADGPPIDGTLLRFAAEARGRRERHAPGDGFPDAARDAWETLSDELDRYLGRALPQTPMLELVRTRVTIESEWAYDVRHFGPAPRELAARVASHGQRLGIRVDAARALGLTMFARRAPGKLLWPLDGASISSVFGPRLDPLTGERRLHQGLDLAAQTGRVVGAAAGGYVVRAGWTGGYGLLVEIRHPGEVTTRYSHLSAILCRPGDALDPGQPVGLVGKTGRATGPHLHFEVWRAGRARDPLRWLRADAAWSDPRRQARTPEPRGGAPR
jgi:murein DD-endopeptidase MepM/ murein hydrolase activator NlpD